MLELKNIKSYINIKVSNLTEIYFDLEDILENENLSDKQKENYVKHTMNVKRQMKNIVQEQQRPLLNALMIAHDKNMLGNREKIILNHDGLIINIIENGHVASISTGNPYGWTTFDIVIKAFGNQSIGNITN